MRRVILGVMVYEEGDAGGNGISRQWQEILNEESVAI